MISSRRRCGASGSTSCAASCPTSARPGHDTLNDVVNALDPDLFRACLASWVETLRDGDPRHPRVKPEDDDLARPRTGHGPENMAIKHMAMNLVRNPSDNHSLKTRRKLANLNPSYLKTLGRKPPR